MYKTCEFIRKYSHLFGQNKTHSYKTNLLKRNKIVHLYIASSGFRVQTYL